MKLIQPEGHICCKYLECSLLNEMDFFGKFCGITIFGVFCNSVLEYWVRFQYQQCSNKEISMLFSPYSSAKSISFLPKARGDYETDCITAKLLF